jgi:hypothetical protein
MPGDRLIANPTKVDTGAVTVNAPPEDIWPWLVQMGQGRGGLSSYDWLDRLFGFLDRPCSLSVLWATRGASDSRWRCETVGPSAC